MKLIGTALLANLLLTPAAFQTKLDYIIIELNILKCVGPDFCEELLRVGVYLRRYHGSTSNNSRISRVAPQSTLRRIAAKVSAHHSSGPTSA